MANSPVRFREGNGAPGIRRPFRGIVVPEEAHGDCWVFAQFCHPTNTSRVDSYPGNDTALLAHPVQVTREPAERYLELNGRVSAEPAGGALFSGAAFATRADESFAVGQVTSSERSSFNVFRVRHE